MVSSNTYPLGLQGPPQKVFGPSWHPPQTPSQKVFGALIRVVDVTGKKEDKSGREKSKVLGAMRAG